MKTSAALKEIIFLSFCWACYMVWCYAIPSRYRLSKLGFAMLPYVGYWGYRE